MPKALDWFSSASLSGPSPTSKRTVVEADDPPGASRSSGRSTASVNSGTEVCVLPFSTHNSANAASKRSYPLTYARRPTEPITTAEEWIPSSLSSSSLGRAPSLSKEETPLRTTNSLLRGISWSLTKAVAVSSDTATMRSVFFNINQLRNRFLTPL